MSFSRTLGWASGGGSEPSGDRVPRQRDGAKLIAFALFSSVRSQIGRRRRPSVSVVPTAMLSYAAHASYMHVWAIARARATTGGPLRNALLKRTSARAAPFQSLTTVADADAAHTSAVTSMARVIIGGNNRMGPSRRAPGPIRRVIVTQEALGASGWTSYSMASCARQTSFSTRPSLEIRASSVAGRAAGDRAG